MHYNRLVEKAVDEIMDETMTVGPQETLQAQMATWDSCQDILRQRCRLHYLAKTHKRISVESIVREFWDELLNEM